MPRSTLVRVVLATVALVAFGAGCSDSKSPATATASSAAPKVAAGDFSQLCPALGAFQDPFKNLPPVPTPKQTEDALNALQFGYEVLARVAPPPVDQHIRSSLDALRAYDRFLSDRSYDLVGLEGDARTEHDRLEAAYVKEAGVVEAEVKAACPTTTTSS